LRVVVNALVRNGAAAQRASRRRDSMIVPTAAASDVVAFAQPQQTPVPLAILANGRKL
jgi:hypothetical protein